MQFGMLIRHKNTAFWNVTTCRLVVTLQCFC